MIARTGTFTLSVMLVALLIPLAVSGQGWEITGTLVNVEGDGVGNGIDFIDIDVYPMSDPTLLLSLTADTTEADGTFAFTVSNTPAAPSGDYAVAFKPDSEYVDLLIEDLFLSGDKELGTITIHREITLTGRVVDEAGDGIPSVDLQLVNEDGVTVDFGNDNTDIDGYFSVVMLDGTWDVVVRQTPGVDLVSVLLPGQVLTGDTDLGDITMLSGYPLTGITEDLAGDAVANVDIDVIDAETLLKIHTTGDNTSTLGEFSVIVPAIDIIVEFRPAPGSNLAAKLELFTVEVPPPANDMGIIVLEDGVEVTGTTVDGNLDPVEDVDLDFLVTSTQEVILTANDNSDASGNFTVVVAEGTYDIQFRPPLLTGLAPRVTTDNVVGASGLDVGDIELDPGINLSGTVINGVDAVERVEVTLSDSATGDAVYVFGNDTNATGVYEFLAPEGTYDVTFTPLDGSGLPTVVVADFELLADEVLDVDFADDVVPAVLSLTCTADLADVNLAWINGAADYDGINVSRDGVFLESLAGTATTHDDLALADGTYTFELVATRGADVSAAVTCEVTVAATPPPVESLACTADGSDVTVSWTNGATDYSDIEVLRDDVLVDTLAGDATELVDLALDDGTYTYEVRPIRATLTGASELCTVAVGDVPLPEFRRGDADGNGTAFALLDALHILAFAFADGTEPPCMDAADVDNNGTFFALLDALFLLDWAFGGGDVPPDPGPDECGPDPEGDTDGLGCETSPAVCL